MVILKREMMKGNQLLRKEFTNYKSKKILIPIIAVLFVPILYAGMFYGNFGIHINS